ncbi:PilZ domain-containing protein [Acidobacteriota bacterium]
MTPENKKRTWKERKEERFEEENKVVIEWADYKEQQINNTIYAFTKDLSISGAKILTDVNFPMNTQFIITLTLSRSKQIISLSAKVKWVKPVYDGDLYEVGLELIHESPQTIAGFFKHLYGKEIPPNFAAKILEIEKEPAVLV